MALLRVDGLSTCLASEAGWVEAIDQLSITIERGQTFALVGESGCGKSMTALSIARLLPDAGAVVAGQVVLSSEAGATDLLRIPESLMRSVRGKRVSMIFQEPGASLNPVMTVGEQLSEVLCLHSGCSASEALVEAENWLIKVGIPEPRQRLKQYPFELSGGQKQRVMIAMALAVKPDLLIADEPTTALDVAIQAQVLRLLTQLQQEQGMAMLLITHDLGIVKHMADTVGLMYAGQLVEVASCEAFFARPSHPYAHALMKSLPSAAQVGRPLYALEGRVPSLVRPADGCRFAARCVHQQAGCVDENIPLLSVSNDHAVRCVRYSELDRGVLDSIVSNACVAPKQAFAAAPVLQVLSLGVAYRQRTGIFRSAFKQILNGLELTLWPGKTLALVGESGSGKTTAARALLGLLPDGARVQGDVLLAGKPLRLWPELGVGGWRAKLQFVFQDPFASLNPRHRVLEILEEPLLSLRPDLDADQVGLPQDALFRFPHEFSGGQRQRIAIARALVSEPDILVCDEPTSALDVSVQAQILNLLKRLQNTTGVSIVFITHNLNVVRYFADEVVVLRHGEVVERAATAVLFSNPQHSYTRDLIAAAPTV
jgi:peptide/nickel transport system ATP-binding protein